MPGSFDAISPLEFVMNTNAQSHIEIIEIGHIPLVAHAYPEITVFLDTTFTTLKGGIFQRLSAVCRTAWQILSTMLSKNGEFIVCRCFGRFIYRRDMSLVTNLMRYMMGIFIKLCVRLGCRGRELAVVDMLDEITIDRRDLWLLALCKCYFKRELPQNAWTAFQRIQPRHGEYILLTRNKKLRSHIQKFRPISLGFERDNGLNPLVFFKDKPCKTERKYDIFFAGETDHSTVRLAGLEIFSQLASEGFRVHILSSRVPEAEFLTLLSESWLVWSPEGSGWDCYRHYETCLAGSVPVMNLPSINRYAPLKHGVHCFFYAMEGDELATTIRNALTDKARLLQMGQEARNFVHTRFTRAALGAYIVTEMKKKAREN
jgi:hypothetical protein